MNLHDLLWNFNLRLKTAYSVVDDTLLTWRLGLKRTKYRRGRLKIAYSEADPFFKVLGYEKSRLNPFTWSYSDRRMIDWVSCVTRIEEMIDWVSCVTRIEEMIDWVSCVTRIEEMIDWVSFITWSYSDRRNDWLGKLHFLSAEADWSSFCLILLDLLQ